MRHDPWLERWLERLRCQTHHPAILELGCGTGRDTAYLAQHGFTRITATDLSMEALAECRCAVPAADIVCHDLREPLPFADNSVDVVVASLCLHYFAWDKTLDMVRGIHRCLVPGGLLLCRVNSTRDAHYGAVGHREIAHHYYDVDGKPKRFFDREEIDALFGSGWLRIATQEMSIDRYEMPKVVWEVVAKKAGE